MTKTMTKRGEYGTLYRYEITYTDPCDDGIGELTQRTWAYSIEHALDKFYGAPDGDTGWKALRIARMPESGSMHRAVQHQV
jgi:hypothetical protein